MGDRGAALGERLRALDAKVARATAEGTPFDSAVGRATRLLHGRLSNGQQQIAGRLPEDARARLTAAGNAVRRGIGVVGTEPTGLLGAGIVLVLAWILTWLMWTPLSWPASIVNSLVATATPTSCSFLGPQNFVSDNACGTVLAVVTALGAIAAMLGVLLLRLPIRRILSAVFSEGPAGLGFVGAPLLATMLFTMGWAGVQYHFPERPGIVADGSFPVVVGVLTYGLATYGPRLQTVAATVFQWRDGVPSRQRLGATILTPVVFSLAATPLLSTPVRDQSTVIVAMLVGYVLMAPRAVSDADAQAERST